MEKLFKQKLILSLIFNFLLLFFLISFVFSQNLKNYILKQYILKQIVNINDEKYIINSSGKISFRFSNLGVSINVYKVNYVIYKEIGNELIRLSSNYFENVSTNLKKIDSYSFKSDNNPKFNTYFYPFFYIFAVLSLDKDNKLSTKIKLKLNDSFLNIVKIQNNIIEFQEIYKNEIVSNGKLLKKSNQNFKLILNYSINNSKEEKDSFKGNINLKGSYVEVDIR